MIAGIDSMIVVYAGYAPSNPANKGPEFEELRCKAMLLFFKLAEAEATVILPTVALSELLIPVPNAQRGALIAKLTDLFVCPPLDLAASAIAADLWARHKSLPQNLQYERRQVLRADTLIVASAKVAGATHFYTNDEKCRALADLVMRGRPLPEKDPSDMFLMNQIRKGELPAPKKFGPRKKERDASN